jgi:membrane peptidoglycan carboxypeptidase
MSIGAVQRGIKFRRREALALFLGCAGANSLAPKPLARFFAGAPGGAILLDVATRRAIAMHNADVTAAPPGSTVKPFALAALLDAGKLTATESMVCPGKLSIAGRQLNCSHPAPAEPMRVETAIAYSCNCFVAHVAGRFAAGELAAALERAGFAHGVRAAQSADAIRLQALGEEGVLASAADLAAAYRWLALTARGPVLAGLEGAVEYGTAQLARVDGATTAGKTGTVRSAAGNRIAWFAGFFPSRRPQVALAVMVAGTSGGGDAAPIAGRIFAAYRVGAL